MGTPQRRVAGKRNANVSRIFPRNSRAIAGKTVLGVLLFGSLACGAVWYYATPKYYRVGYAPIQPIPFSHALHVQQVGLDCTYCHNHVKESPFSNVPITQTCWNCHGADKANIKANSPLLAPLREAHQSGRPIPWVRIHKVPDFVYFNHQAHVNRGVSCVSCHGQVNEMTVMREEKPLSMSWCLSCHRDPGPNLRPNDQVTNLSWDPRLDPTLAGRTPQENARLLAAHSGVRPPTDCTGCHR